MKRMLLVAKPWRGGLADYIYRAMQAEPGTSARWIPTAPVGFAEQLAYRRHKGAWRERLVAQINAADYDLALFINFLPEYKELRHRPQNILWLTDDPRSVISQSGPFGGVFLSDPGYLDECRSLPGGERLAGILPFGFDPELHAPEGPGQKQRGLCFIANRDEKRDRHLQHLFDRGCPVRIYGNYFLNSPLFWRHPTAFRPAIPYRRMGEIYARHFASLNIHAQVLRGGTNMRTFECAGFGIPQVVEYRPHLEEYFEPGEELLVYHQPEQLQEAVSRLLGDRQLCHKLAGRARARALADHSYQARLKRILDFLN